MSGPVEDPAFDPRAPIGPRSVPLLAEYVMHGCKPRSAWGSGVELELFGYYEEGLERIDPATVEAVLTDCALASGESLEREGDFPIEALVPSGRVTVEPGGQIEFSGWPQPSLEAVASGARLWLDLISRSALRRGLLFVASGFDPLRSLREQRWYPKRRYALLRPFLAERGRRGWDMMTRTAAMQASFDYDSAEDLAMKFTVGNRLGPIVAAIFASSPFEAGRLSGYKSTRYAVWLETDAERSGVSPLAIEETFSVERFLDYLLSLPMVFVRRGDRYLDAGGRRFADHLADRAAGAIFQDFLDHLSTVFTDARVKQYVEMRSADAGTLEWTLAHQALWKGLLYERSALETAIALGPRLDANGFLELQLDVARNGLQARAGDVDVLGMARDLVRLARAGLEAIAPEETRFLEPLLEYTLDEGISPADRLLRESGGDARRAIGLLKAH